MSTSINTDAIDAVTEGINRVGILDSEINKCVNCGKEGSEVTNTCNKCNSVMYCNAACKKKHRHKHKKQCQRRLAEMRDELLFTQPKRAEDCPICFLRLPSLGTGHIYMPCCGKVLCSGCMCTPVYDDQGNVIKEKTCPFCRTPVPTSNKETIKRFEKRMELNDPRAIYNMGIYYAKGMYGLRPNQAKMLELYHRAAELDDVDAYFSIAYCYRNGRGVEHDMEKAIYYYELGTMRGDIHARYNLGLLEGRAGNMDRALRHWVIAVKDGSLESLENIKRMYKHGHATKDDYANALRSYQSYLNEVKSDQRDKAADRYRYYESVLM